MKRRFPFSLFALYLSCIALSLSLTSCVAMGNVIRAGFWAGFLIATAFWGLLVFVIKSLFKMN